MRERACGAAGLGWQRLLDRAEKDALCSSVPISPSPGRFVPVASSGVIPPAELRCGDFSE